MAELMRDLDAYVAHLPGVRQEVKRVAEERAARVRAVAAGHQDSGEFVRSIKTHSGDTDTIIYSDDPAALSKNYGHQAANGRMVEGIHAFEAGL
ncbi:DUF5403 family protein [Streptomyces noursei]|uniref:DUF5403 family protein n=1 Tax=Streptomyces noursei TaxID=1971 RepID=UPI0023B7F1F5|nr:DUF5403 family protein [Streptomyces noursei]